MDEADYFSIQPSNSHLEREMRRTGSAAWHVVVLASLLVGCATTPTPTPHEAPPAPRETPRTYSLGEEVVFGGMRFHLRSAEYRSSFTNWINQETRASDSFLIIDIASTNLGATPLPMHFQPVFQLIDSRGAVYDASTNHTMMVNMQKPGRSSPGQSWNPNVPVQQEIVFEVPRADYRLRVLVPDQARVGFAGATNVQGRYFYYDLR